MTHSQELFEIIRELDLRASDDFEYAKMFSTYTKTKLRHGETWRSRLVKWAETEQKAGY